MRVHDRLEGRRGEGRVDDGREGRNEAANRDGKEMVALSCTRISHHQIGGLDGRCPEMGWEEEAKGVLDMINA